MKLHRALSFLAILVLFCASAFAQIAADIKGRVIDSSGAAVAHAQVELIQSSTNLHQTTVSSNSGDYLFANINPGSYRLEVTTPGFRHLSRTGVTVIVGQTVSVDLALTPGGDQQTVTVNSDAPVL